MEQSDDTKQQVVEFLKERGHNHDEIHRIIAALEQYDEKTIRDAIFDSIGSGLNINDLITDTLKK